MSQPLTRSQIDRFMNLVSALSPENLFQDGERPAAAARRVERSLKAQWKALEAEVGRPVDDSEVWAAFLTTPRSANRAIAATVRS